MVPEFDNKTVCIVSSLRVKFNIDLTFSELNRFYSIKFKKHMDIDREKLKKSWKEFMK